MTTIEIILLIIGVVMMVASFFVTEKLSNQDLDKIAELSTEEMQRILERSLTDAQVKVDNMVDQVIDHSIEKSMEVVERALDKETNEKMRAITEYSDTVLESIHKTHNEVMFLYSMLNDKHSELTKYAGNLAQLAIHLEELQENVQKTLDQSDEILNTAQASAKPVRTPEPDSPKLEPKEEAPVVPQKEEDETLSHNQMILNMYRQGKNAVDIAKELGLGVGEVKLVIGLFREEDL
ncbi:hypothetical protein C806_03933 [Lachnospiraceae bacterium 3-1]|nr:hypothetical protein C806_03933 [Lachnospiraceae bacterium 3-1]